MKFLLRLQFQHIIIITKFVSMFKLCEVHPDNLTKIKKKQKKIKIC